MVNIAQTVIFTAYFERAGNIDNPTGIRVGFDKYSTRAVLWEPRSPRRTHYQRFLVCYYLRVKKFNLAATFRYT